MSAYIGHVITIQEQGEEIEDIIAIPNVQETLDSMPEDTTEEESIFWATQDIGENIADNHLSYKLEIPLEKFITKLDRQMSAAGLNFNSHAVPVYLNMGYGLRQVYGDLL